MNSDFKSSINKILNERLTSPFWGALVFSWLVWNWKIVYLTCFVNQDKIPVTKIEYIVANYFDRWDVLWFPIISTILLVSVMPLLTNAAYWVSINYDKWRYDQKNKVEAKTLLTVEQSVQLREQVRNQEEKFERLLSVKESEYATLNAEVNVLKVRHEDTLQKANELEIKNVELRSNIAEFDNVKLLLDTKSVQNDVMNRERMSMIDNYEELKSTFINAEDHIQRLNENSVSQSDIIEKLRNEVKANHEIIESLGSQLEYQTSLNRNYVVEHELRFKTPYDEAIKTIINKFSHRELEKILSNVALRKAISNDDNIAIRLLNMGYISVIQEDSYGDIIFEFTPVGMQFRDAFFKHFSE